MASSSSALQNQESSASLRSSSAPDAGYDVFINHRGPDSKKTIVSHVYRRLTLHGLRAFLDAEELQEGQSISHQIAKAIETASVHVLIFSPRYAESPWCLNELLLILQSGTPVVPVFYHVKPSFLRGNYGPYAQALSIHEERQRYAFEHIQQWRAALSGVSDIWGFEIEAFNGDEAELVEKVVERVLKIVVKSAPIENRPLPSRQQADEEQRSHSLKEKIEEFEERIPWHQQTENPHIVGIVGSAGIGKTTLAKELFDRKKSFFSRSFFLSNVREKARKNGLHFLQRELCKGLINLDIQVDSVTGRELFEENVSYIYGSSALVVLDDVDHLDQLQKLLPGQNYSASKNWIILITSRNEAVLLEYGIEGSSIYNLSGLNLEHSKQLFCYKAFNQDPPPPAEFEHVVDKFLEACEGFPFHLELYGTLCHKKDISDWEDQVESLLDLDLKHSLPDWDCAQLDRLPRDIEKFKDLSRRARDLIKFVLLQRQSGEVQVVGIVGLDGMGKTFLAKELFKMKKSTYSKSCILYDVRSCSLCSLLKKLLKGLTQLDIKVDSVDEGIDLFKEHVSSFPSLVILDNVVHWDPMDAFLSVLATVLPSSSLVLITSRDKEVLKRSGVKEPSVYVLNGLHEQDTLELFCTHAFGQSCPLPGFEDLVNGFLQACNGLPLTLRVFGAFLSEKKDRYYWQDQLGKLQQMAPTDIQRILQIIYDGLTMQEQQIFLHIACFCTGEKKALAVRLWDRSGSAGSLEFESLQRKCLAEVDSEGCIVMHEQLRDLGRTIAHKKGFLRPLYPPSENNRDLLQQSSNEQVITDVLPRNIDDLLQQSSVIREVRGFMIMIIIMMMSMMIWSVGLKIILMTIITAMIIWSMPKGS